MKNEIYLFLIFGMFFISCKVDETIEEKYRQPFSHYSIGDTIFFKNNTKGLDTIRIASIDSFSTSGGLSSPPFKVINLKIEHLPINKWYSYLISDGTNTKLDTILTDFIHLYKYDHWNKKHDKYYMHVQYRDFYGVLDVNKIHKNKIDTIKPKKLYGDRANELDEEAIIEVYWSLNNGLIGYKKNNGEVYKLFNK